MIWSISKYRYYLKCPRRWFYNEKFASESDNAPLRKEAYYLSQLNSIDGWKGNIVDFSIEVFIIPLIKQKRKINLDDILQKTKTLTRERYNFAISKKYREEGLKKGNHVRDYAALYCFEYPVDYDLNEKFIATWEQIETSLINFVDRKDLIEYLKSADQLVTQRRLSYQKHNATVVGVPDLIAFFKDNPPHIFDWKAHYAGIKNYSQQLITYAVALHRTDMHADFEIAFKNYSPLDYKLTEYQLIANLYRDHSVEDDFIEEVEDFIADGIYTMQKQGCDQEYKKLDINNFRTTSDPRDCEKCPFKKICWEG